MERNSTFLGQEVKTPHCLVISILLYMYTACETWTLTDLNERIDDMRFYVFFISIKSKGDKEKSLSAMETVYKSKRSASSRNRIWTKQKLSGVFLYVSNLLRITQSLSIVFGEQTFHYKINRDQESKGCFL